MARFPGGKELEDINETVIDEVIVISTLNDYFCNIVELAKVNTQYVVLPLDEEPFEINANARTINVPASFKKNGAGVQGDHTAETVYFVIDRYFDNVDLAEEDIFIAIQWEGAKKEDAGFDLAVFKDTVSIQNKIIFGWVLNDQITKNPGNIKFAVHFFKGVLDEASGKIKEVKYSFNTLTAQIAINKAFDFDVSSFDPNQNPSQLILDRLTNSKADGAVEALYPIYIINLPEAGKVDLKDTDGIDEDVTTYTFNVLASSPDAGHIEYTWYKDGVEVTPEKVSFKYIETEDEVLDSRKIYYAYTIATDSYDRFMGTEFVEGVTYYERRSCCIADSVGEYFVIVKNIVGTDNKELKSNKVIIPRPTMPDASTIIITDYDANIYYGWDEKAGYIRATKRLEDESKVLNISAEPNEGDTIQYQWYKIAGATEHLNEIPNIDSEDYELIPLEGQINNTYTAIETGWYTVDIVGERNGATVSFPSEKYYRFTSLPELPLFVVDGLIEEDISLPNGEYVKVELQALEYSDTVNYKWYIDVEPFGTAEEDEEKDVEIPAFEGLSEISNTMLYDYIGKVLYCKPTNIYNGVSITGVSSRRFTILKSEADRPENIEIVE